MYSTTLCFLIKNTPTPQLLLGKKKTGFGKGKYNGFGGKLEAGETPKQAAVREVWEECGIILQENTLQEAGYLEFIFPAAPELDHDVFIYFACEWQGQAVETEPPGLYPRKPVGHDKQVSVRIDQRRVVDPR